MHMVSWTLALVVFWLLLSGYFKALLLFFGAVSVALVVVTVRKMDSVDSRPQPLRVDHKLLLYFVWLIGQIVRSSLDVAKLVWLSPNKIEPSLGVISTKTTEETGNVLYANSITLTPGTLSVDLSEDTVTVHALQTPSLEELEQGDMEARVIKASGGSKQ